MAVDTPAPAPAYGDRRERVGWYFYDWAVSAFSTSVVTVFLGPYLTAVTNTAAGCVEAAAIEDGCPGAVVRPLGIVIAAGSWFPYLVSLSVFLTVFVLPLVGALADRSPDKRRLLAVTAFTGAGATIGLVFLTGDRYLLGGLLFVIANIAAGASVVVYNSFLPQIAEPDRRDAVSSAGWALGYLGGGLLLAVHVVAVTVGGSLGWSTGDVARWSMVSAGIWWAGFTLVPLAVLRARPALEPAAGPAVIGSLRQLGATLRGLRAYPLTLLFLVAFLVYNDGIQTVIALAATYGSQELRLDETVLVGTILLVQLLAFAGALLLGALARRIGAKRTVLASLVVWTAVLGIAYVLPARQVVPFVLLGGLIGLVLGGSQALSRSLFSQLIPPGKEAEYFGLYEISDKGTSWLGPLLFAVTYQLTGSYRLAIISLLVFFGVGFGLLTLVPVRRAILAAGNVPPERVPL